MGGRRSDNPRDFAAAVAAIGIVEAKLADQLVDGIKYEKMNSGPTRDAVREQIGDPFRAERLPCGERSKRWR